MVFLPAGIRLHHAGIDRKAFAADQTGVHALLQDPFEHKAEPVGLTEAAGAVLGEGGLIWYSVRDLELTEPAVRQVQLHFFAQHPVGADP
jgi:hypothetical protein